MCIWCIVNSSRIYSSQVREHSTTSASNSLYQGQDFTSLAQFLGIPFQQRRTQSTFTNPIVSPHISGHDFALAYNLQPGTSPTAIHLSLPLQELPTREDSASSESGILIFLKGFPSPEWLNEIGSHYQVDPEFYYRHLSFLHSSTAAERQTPFTLPSSQRSIFQITLTSVGHHSSVEDVHIAKLRSRTAKNMESYYQNLKKLSGWKLGNSIVRSFAAHNREEFSIEQLVTVYVSKLEKGGGRWLGKH